MCQKAPCSHGGEGLCTCKAITSRNPEAIAIHMFQNVHDLKMELDYKNLKAPAPYRLCAFGACKRCGGRLCIRVELPDHLFGDGLLAVIYHHMKRLHMAAESAQFAALFHEADQAAVLQWLKENGLAEGET